MNKVRRILAVTPLWGFSLPAPGDWRLVLGRALEAKGVLLSLAGPVQGRGGELEEEGIRIFACPVPRRPSPYSAVLARRLLPSLAAAAARSQAELVHYGDLRLAALGIPGGLPATGWLADTVATGGPLLPFSLVGSGPGWFRRWREARRARALQVAALARLAGLAVDSQATGEAATRVQGRGIPLTHLLPPPAEDPVGHAAGLVRLWEELPI